MSGDGINGFRTTSINDSIEPTREDLFAVALKAGLNKREAVETFERIEETVRKFNVR